MFDKEIHPRYTNSTKYTSMRAFAFRVALINRVQFGRANTNINNSGFGQVRGTINTGPRNIQLGLRLGF